MRRLRARATTARVRLAWRGAFLETGDTDPSFPAHPALHGARGHELAAPFFAQRIRRIREFVAGYIAERIRAGAFRAMDPTLGARAFLGMVVDYLIVRQIFQQKDVYGEGHGPQQVADAFVAIFLDGIRRRDEGSDV